MTSTQRQTETQHESPNLRLVARTPPARPTSDQRGEMTEGDNTITPHHPARTMTKNRVSGPRVRFRTTSAPLAAFAPKHALTPRGPWLYEATTVMTQRTPGALIVGILAQRRLSLRTLRRSPGTTSTVTYVLAADETGRILGGFESAPGAAGGYGWIGASSGRQPLRATDKVSWVSDILAVATHGPGPLVEPVSDM